LSAALPMVLSACNDYPVHRLLDSFEVRVTDKLAHDKPVKLDFLWVIDQSASMCQEQRALSAAFEAFTSRLSKLGAIDAQMAVVTAQQAQDKSEIKVIGRFMHKAATAFPPNCMERTKMHCLNNGHCKALKKNHSFKYPKFTDSSMCSPNPAQIDAAAYAKDKNGKEDPNKPIGKWFCKTPPTVSHVSNLNCSVNSECQSRCDPGKGNVDCESVYGKGALCKIPGGGTNKDDAGCIFPPDTKACPGEDKLPPVVGQADLLKYFKCNATVGAAQTPESRFEGGFRSAWMALDPKGPNCDYQACYNHLRVCCPKVNGKTQAWCANDFHQGKCNKHNKEMCEPLKNKKNCQATSLLRDDAYLIIVFISDDDDCSMRLHLNPLDKKVITKEVWDSCQVFGDALGGNTALNEGNCEFKQSKVKIAYDKATTPEAKAKIKDIYCPSDCQPGSTSKALNGLLKCPKKCAVTCDFACASGYDKGKEKAAKDAFAKDWTACPQHCRTDSPERATCLQKAYEDLNIYTKKAGQFAPVDEYVALFKSLKPDPARVIVAAITGDAISTNLDKKGNVIPLPTLQKHRDRVNYYHSMLKDQGPGQAPYVCRGKRGESNYGSRYIQLTEAFRDNGVFYNVCEGEDFGPALVNIADTILKRVTKICLPQPPFYDDKGQPIVKAQRNRGGQDKVLEYNDSCDPNKPDTFCIKPSPDCRAAKADLVGKGGQPCKDTKDCEGGLSCIDGRCLIYNDAIFFPVVQETGDQIQISYETDLGF